MTKVRCDNILQIDKQKCEKANTHFISLYTEQTVANKFLGDRQFFPMSNLKDSLTLQPVQLSN